MLFCDARREDAHSLRQLTYYVLRKKPTIIQMISDHGRFLSKLGAVLAKGRQQRAKYQPVQ